MTRPPSTKSGPPLVSIIIPHWKGKDILVRCLESVRTLTYKPIEILLVDNGSDDGSVPTAAELFPEASVVHSGQNLGYAGGCNLGLSRASGEFALLLNDDAVVTAELLGLLVAVLQADPGIAACQPKILSLKKPGTFDYAGAAGGEMDRYGFPFCRGRLFDTVETDSGQYDAPSDIVWASGACCLVRTGPVREAGMFDTTFFAHMEEIDLQWRLRNAGFRIVSVPGAVARHEAGSTLAADTPFKVYLNHRNSLRMMLKNLRTGALLRVLPVRIFLDLLAVLYRLVRLQPANAFAVTRSLGHVVFHLPEITRSRKGGRPGGLEGLYQGSIVWEYFVLKRRSFSSLMRNAGSGG